MKYFDLMRTCGFGQKELPDHLILSHKLYNIVHKKISITKDTTLYELALLLGCNMDLNIFKDIWTFKGTLAYKLKKELNLKESRDDLGIYIEESIIESIDYLDYGYYITETPYNGDNITNLKQLLKNGLLSKINYDLFPICSDYNIFETTLGIRRELNKQEATKLEELFEDKAILGYTADGKHWYSIDLGTSEGVTSIYCKDLNLLEVTKFILEHFTREQADYLLSISNLYNNTRARQFIFKSIDGKFAIPLKGFIQDDK